MSPKPKTVTEQIETYRRDDASRVAHEYDTAIAAQETRERGCKHVADDLGEFCVRCEAWMGVGI